jgi:hypothetical protein
MIFLLCNDFVSSVPISPVAPVISTDLEAPEIHQSQTKQMKKGIRKVHAVNFTAVKKRSLN